MLKNVKKLAVKADEKKVELAKIRQALQVAEREGLNLVPVYPGTKKVALSSWTYYQENRSTPEEWEEWFIKGNYSVGVVCGKTSGNLVVVDCDEKGNLKKVFNKPPKELAQDTLVAETGSKKGHHHVYYKTDFPVRGKKFREINMEILGQGNIAVFPPSWHASGNRYQFLEPTTPIAHYKGDFVEEMYELFEQAFGKKFKPDRKTINIDALLRGVEHGYRDEAAIRIASWYRQGGLEEEDAEALLTEWNSELKEPLEEWVIHEKIQSAYGKAEPYKYKFNRQYVPETVYPQEIRSKAEEILEKGDPFNAVNEAARLLHAGDEKIIQVEWVSALSSRLTTIKINTWQIGKSQKGKSHSMYTTLQLLPPEYYEVFTSTSPLSFFYYIKKFGEWSLDKKLIYIDEIEASKQALPILRSLTGQTPIKPRHLSVHEAEVLDLQIKGSRAVWFTSVQTFGSEQIKNRFIHLNPDETTEQDDRVFELQDIQFRKGEMPEEEPLIVIQAMTQKIGRDTEKMKVAIPFEIDWIYKDRRWLYPIFLSFIKVTAKVMYKQRKIKDNVITATQADFRRAKDLWQTFIKSIIMRVTQTALTIYELLPDDPEEALTHAEISEMIACSTRTVQNHCREMWDEGLINARKRGRKPEQGGRNAWEYWRAALPSIDRLCIKDRVALKEKKKRKKNEKSNLKKPPLAVSESGNASHATDDGYPTLDEHWFEKKLKANE